MSTIPLARRFVDRLDSLSLDNKNHIKDLLNFGRIVPDAIVGSTCEELIEIINRYPVGGSISEPVIGNGNSFFYFS